MRGEKKKPEKKQCVVVTFHWAASWRIHVKYKVSQKFFSKDVSLQTSTRLKKTVIMRLSHSQQHFPAVTNKSGHLCYSLSQGKPELVEKTPFEFHWEINVVRIWDMGLVTADRPAIQDDCNSPNTGLSYIWCLGHVRGWVSSSHEGQLLELRATNHLQNARIREKYRELIHEDFLPTILLKNTPGTFMFG